VRHGVLFVALTLVACSKTPAPPPTSAPQVVASRFGEYARVASPQFQEFVRESRYVETRDGTRLALDIVRPAKNGRPSTEPRGVILEITPYGRAWLEPSTNKLIDCIACEHHFWRYGYVTVALDARGTGASFGTTVQGPYTREGGRDAHDVIEWIARQPWSNGKVGMVGGSFAGRIQYHAAAEAPPSLKAIMPAYAAFDSFDGHAVRGGMVSQAALAWSGASGSADDTTMTSEPIVAPVDGPAGSESRDAARAFNARAEAAGSDFFAELGAAFPGGIGRDEISWGMRLPPTGFVNHVELLPLINRAKVPAYLWHGWTDAFIVDGLRWFANLSAARRITVGNWPHAEFSRGEARDARDEEQRRLYQAESLRWFDHWLLGIDTSVLRDAPVQFAMENSAQRWNWRASNDLQVLTRGPSTVWRLANTPQSKALAQTTGVLVADSSIAALGVETMFKRDPTATTGRGRSWEAIDTVDVHRDFGLPELYPDLAANDLKGASFTSAAISEPLSLIGAPRLTLHLSADTPDAALVVTLSEVFPDGRSRYLSQASLRASFRTLGSARYENFGWTFLSGLASDAAKTAPLTSGPAEMVFTLEPIAREIALGQRLRVTVHAADADNLSELTLPQRHPRRLTVHHSERHPSRLELPISRARAQ
jgi:uncharacterized protein